MNSTYLKDLLLPIKIRRSNEMVRKVFRSVNKLQLFKVIVKTSTCLIHKCWSMKLWKFPVFFYILFTCLHYFISWDKLFYTLHSLLSSCKNVKRKKMSFFDRFVYPRWTFFLSKQTIIRSIWNDKHKIRKDVTLCNLLISWPQNQNVYFCLEQNLPKNVFSMTTGFSHVWNL